MFKDIGQKDLEIKPIQTSKDKIEQPALAKHEMMIIPPLGSSVIISGKSGSGKSTLLAELLTSWRFYGPSKHKPEGWFDELFLFSPTANGDDIQKSLGIPSDHVFTDLEEAPECLDAILNTQQQKIDSASGADKVKQYAVIFDDVIGDKKFMNHKAFTRCFYQVRHVNCTTFICTQHFKRVPRICRLQANFIFFFQGSQTEVETVAEEFAPPNVKKKDFMAFVDDVTSEDYAFLTINMKVPARIRFRKRLGEIATNFYGESDKDVGAKQTTYRERQTASPQYEGGETRGETFREPIRPQDRSRYGKASPPSKQVRRHDPYSRSSLFHSTR